jgi:hypothetical protein
LRAKWQSEYASSANITTANRIDVESNPEQFDSVTGKSPSATPSL